MDKDDEWKELGKEFKIFTRWILSGLIDSSFLVLWVLVQWGSQKSSPIFN